MIKTTKTLFLASLLSATTLAGAQAKDIDYNAFSSLFGEPVTTGATGVPQRASDVPVNMTILSADDIRRSAARTIPDVLRQVPGVNVRQNSHGDYNVGIRGYNQPYSERLLVLLDGRPVYQDFYGFVAWNAIPVALNEIKQIEVIKGPNTALYGFNATSGVINIITYNPRFDDYSNVTASGGTGEYFEGSGTTTLRNENGGVRVSVSGYGAENFDTPTASGLPGTETANNYNRFYKLKGGYEIADGVDVNIELSDTSAATPTMLSSGAFGDNDYQTQSAKFNIAAETDYGTWDLLYYNTQTDALLELATFGTAFKDKVQVAQVSNIFKVGNDHTFRVQAEYRDASGNGPVFTNRIDQDVITGSGLWSWAINDQFTLSNAVRYDMLSMEREDGNPSFDRDIDALSVNSGLVYKATEVDTFRLTFARAVDLPSFAEFSSAPSNEISTVHNYGIDYSHVFTELNTTFGASVYYQDVKDMQDFSSAPTTSTNKVDSEAVGGELSLDGTFAGGWRWGVGYGYVSTDDSSTAARSALDGAIYEDAQSEHIVTGNLGYSQDNWSVDVYTNYMSGYDASNLAGTDIDGVLLGSVKLNYRPMENLNLSLTGFATLNGDKSQTLGHEVEDSIFASVSFTF